MADRPPTSRARGRSWLHWVWRPALVLVIAGALGWWMLEGAWFQRRARAPSPPEAPSAAAPTDPEPRAWRPRPITQPAPGCQPEAERQCQDGDAWWLDSCGVIYARAEDCDARLCDEGECEPQEANECEGESILGRCDGEIARGCEGGRRFTVDCAALDRRCVQTEEGPVCRPHPEDACDSTTEAPRCEGDTLVICHEGERQRIDCRVRGAICGLRPQSLVPSCVQLPPPILPDDCEDACGCLSEERSEEICDGRDNDADGFIDESGHCEAIDLVVFVIVDSDGRGSYAREDVDAEIARLGRLLAREDDYGLEVRLAEVVRLAEPAWLELDDEELGAMLRSATLTTQHEGFFVPIVLTDRVFVDAVPRPAASTVPNGTCGGRRRLQGAQPPLGVIVMGKHHWETTLAHELGHFLGLCHTHADHPAPIVAVDPGAEDDAEEARACAEACTIDDDGLCDTPVDPGPGPCVTDLECNARCEDGSTPDPSNIMGYYPRCRVGFTVQQALLMRRTLALRRGWHACITGDGCSCEPGVGTCPEGMSCRRYVGESTPRCALDGPAVPGGVCEGSGECSQGSLCIGQPDADSRCVRPCDDDTPGCRCVEVGGVTHPICIDDLRRSEE